MGCPVSKLDGEEAVQLCKDRKKFVKQAVEQRSKFASGHIAYIQSMKRASIALREYVEGDKLHERIPGFTTISPCKSQRNSSYKISYCQSSGNSSVSVEERPPQSPETFRVEVHQFGTEGIFEFQSSPMNSSFCHYPPNNQPNHAPTSQTSQLDFFWDPFSSLDYYGYPTINGMEHENEGLRRVQEEEGILGLENGTEQEIDNTNKKMKGGNIVNINENRDNGNSDVSKKEHEKRKPIQGNSDVLEKEHERKKPIQGMQSEDNRSIEVAKSQYIGQTDNNEITVSDCKMKEGTPGFTVYVDRRPTSMYEVVNDLKDQFMASCNAAKEVSSILETRRTKYSSAANDFAALKIFNPAALFRPASSVSSFPRFIDNTTRYDEDYESSSSDFSEEFCVFRGSHQSTLDRLYAWEKKLYQEVRAGSRVRLAYEKKCGQLRNQETRGEDSCLIEKTRAAIRSLHTQIKVSIHSVEAVSKRIETLRDEELDPQIFELVQGLARMWQVMAECHRLQKQTLDEAKLLLVGARSKPSRTEKHTVISPSEPHNLDESAANLEAELRNWRSCFASWFVSQRSYVHSLTGWLLCCIQADQNSGKQPFFRRMSLEVPPIFKTCIQWSKILDTIHEDPVLDGIDFFAAGVGSLCAQQVKEDSLRHTGGSIKFEAAIVGNKMEVGEADHLEDEEVTAERMAEFAARVLYAGMSVSLSSLTEFAATSAGKYADLVKQRENSVQPHMQSGM